MNSFTTTFVILFTGYVAYSLATIFLKNGRQNEIPSSIRDALFRLATNDIMDCSTYCFQIGSCHTMFFAMDSGICQGYTLATVQMAIYNVQPHVVRFSLQNGCTEHGYTLLTKVSMCVRLNSDQLTWHEARRTCQKDGADLAIIDTEEKVTVVSDYVQMLYNYNRWYVGLRESNGSWTWLNHQALSDKHRYFNRVRAHFNDCGALRVDYYQFNDCNCTVARRSMCEKALP